MILQPLEPSRLQAYRRSTWIRDCEPCAFSRCPHPGFRPGLRGDESSCQIKRMAGAQHRRQRLFARPRDRRLRRRTGRSCAARRSAARRPRRPPAPRLARSAAVLLADPGRAQAPHDPRARHSRAGRARRRAPRRRRGRRHSRAPPCARPARSTGGACSARPAPLAQLAGEIGGELGAGRRVAPGIGERRLLERRCVERRSGALLRRASPPCLCHSRAGL